MKLLVRGIPFYFARNLQRFPQLRHFFATRQGGVSTGSYGSLNVGLATEDNPVNVWENRRRIAKAFDLNPDNMLFPGQTHSNQVVLIENQEQARQPYPDTDALITREKELVLCVQTADCAPVIFYDPDHEAIGIAHAGWRGAVNGILQNVVAAMQQHFRTKPDRLQIATGPSISPEVYEVGRNVSERVFDFFPEATARQLLKPLRGNKFVFNLWEANKQQLLMANATQEHIEILRKCTLSHPKEFFSARYAQGQTGRMASGVFLK